MAFSFSTKPTANVFSTQAPTQGSLFGNTTQSSTAGTLFGSSQQTTSAPPFTKPSAVQATSTAGSLFGASTKTSGGLLFASKPLSLATTTTSTTAAPLFGAPATTTTASAGLFGTSTATSQQNATSSVVPLGTPYIATLAESVDHACLYGDERDNVATALNQLLVMSAPPGAHLYYHALAPTPLTVNELQPFYRFNGLVYNNIPSSEDSDGLVSLTVHKSASLTLNQRQLLIDGIASILGGNPSIKVNIDSVSELSPTILNNTTVERWCSNIIHHNRRAPATQLYNFLLSQKEVLKSQNQVHDISLCLGLSNEQLKQYLQAPPPGLDPHVFFAAVANNPNLDKYLPVALRGFEELKQRYYMQLARRREQSCVLEKAHEKASQFQDVLLRLNSRLSALTIDYEKDAFRLLRIVCKRWRAESRQPFSADEEELGSAAENLSTRLRSHDQLVYRVADVADSIQVNAQLFASTGTGSILNENDASLADSALKRQQDDVELLENALEEDERDINELLKLLIEGEEQQRRAGVDTVYRPARSTFGSTGTSSALRALVNASLESKLDYDEMAAGIDLPIEVRAELERFASVGEDAFLAEANIEGDEQEEVTASLHIPDELEIDNILLDFEDEIADEGTEALRESAQENTYATAADWSHAFEASFGATVSAKKFGAINSLNSDARDSFY